MHSIAGLTGCEAKSRTPEKAGLEPSAPVAGDSWGHACTIRAVLSWRTSSRSVHTLHNTVCECLRTDFFYSLAVAFTCKLVGTCCVVRREAYLLKSPTGAQRSVAYAVTVRLDPATRVLPATLLTAWYAYPKIQMKPLWHPPIGRRHPQCHRAWRPTCSRQRRSRCGGRWPGQWRQRPEQHQAGPCGSECIE